MTISDTQNLSSIVAFATPFAIAAAGWIVWQNAQFASLPENFAPDESRGEEPHPADTL